MERAQIVSLAARGAQISSGFITLLVVGHFFDLRTQGYFFTFNSLIALQVFAEMGLSMVLIQFAAHEMPRLRWDQGILTGDPVSKGRMKQLLHFSFMWFGVTAVLLLVLLIPGGMWFFAHSTVAEAQPTSVMASWSLLVLFVSGNLLVTALCNIIEGTGQVSEVAAVRLAQAVSGAAVAWASIAAGAGLMALALQNFTMLAIGLAYLLGQRRTFLVDLLKAPPAADSLRWKSDIFPFQWRIAVSWLSGYFIFQFSTPLLFASHGPEAAGRMGMSMQIFSAISSVCIIFISARAPAFGRLVASQARTELDNLFRRSMIQSFGSLAAMLVLVLLALAVAPQLDPGIGSRMLSFTQSTWLALACLGSHAVYAQAIYLRTHKQEPFMKLSVVNGTLMAILASWAIPNAGTSGAVAAYTVVTLFVSFPLGTWIFLRFKSDFACQGAS